MFSTTTITAALLLTSTTVNAIPIWSRLSAALAIRQDGNATTPIQIAQGSNFFFDSLRLDDPCTSGQIGCISSQLATCSPESNWEISPCASNTTCLAVPASNQVGVFVSCMLFTDGQALIGSQDVSVDFGVTSPPNNTATQPADTVPQVTETGSASATNSPTDSSSDPAPTDAPTDSSSDSVDPTDSFSSDPTPTDEPTSTDTSDPAPTDTSDPTDSSSDSVDPTDSSTDSPVDPSATCTDDAPEPESTEYETITVVIKPNPTLTGQMTTVTLSASPTDTNSTDPTSTDSASPDVTGTDGAVPTSIPEPGATDPTPTGNSTCTEDPSATEDPTDPAPTDSSTDPAPTDSISTDYGTAPTNSSSSSASSTQQTGLTLTVPPNFSLPTATVTTATATDTDTPTTATATDSPANNVAPTPSGSGTPDVSVVGTHVIPAPPSPGRMVRVRRS